MDAKNWWSLLNLMEMNPERPSCTHHARWGDFSLDPNNLSCHLSDWPFQLPRTPGNSFCREKPVREFVCAVFPQAKHLQYHVYSFSTNETTHFWPFCQHRTLLLVPQKCVSAFHREALEAPSLNCLMIYLGEDHGKRRGLQSLEFEKSEDLFEKGPERVLI